MRYLLTSILLCVLHASPIFAQELVPKEMRANVGDIPFDSLTDNPDFEIGDYDTALPYNTVKGMLIEGGRHRVLSYFADNYKQDTMAGQTGFITIRFLVNYKGETDRFRVYEMNEKLQTLKFDPAITKEILTLTKELDGWKQVSRKGVVHTSGLPVETIKEDIKAFDYYQYLHFRMKDGQIETILP